MYVCNGKIIMKNGRYVNNERKYVLMFMICIDDGIYG